MDFPAFDVGRDTFLIPDLLNFILFQNGTVYIADPNFGAVVRFIANKFWFPFSKSGDVRIHSKKELEEIFYNCGFKTVQVYRKGEGVFLKAEK